MPEATRRRFASGSGKFDETFQFADAGRVAHLAECFGLDLADALAGDLELAADFLERAAVAVLEAEALFKHLALAFCQVRERDSWDPNRNRRSRWGCRGSGPARARARSYMWARPRYA